PGRLRVAVVGPEPASPKGLRKVRQFVNVVSSGDDKSFDHPPDRKRRAM
ncbi:MAG: hypothetical protein ACI9W4_002550, partial [Rhodothermales bacterium]